MRAPESLTEAELSFSRSPADSRTPHFAGSLKKTHAVSRAELAPAVVRTKITPWWLWWNLLSLDAPTVALIWSIVFARASGIRLQAASEVVLVLAVFLIYVVDRLLDGWAVGGDSDLHERHFFCARHRRAFAVVAFFAATVIVWLTASRLPIREARAGITLATVVAIYILAIQARRGLATRLPSKEWAVGVLFAAGTTLPVWSHTGKLDGATWVLVILFGLLCSLNCLLIDFWESEDVAPVSSPRRRADFLAGQPGNFRSVGAMPGLLGFGAAAFSWSERIHPPEARLGFAIAVGAVLLLLLNEQRGRFSHAALRVLADAVLVVAGLLAVFLGV